MQTRQGRRAGCAHVSRGHVWLAFVILMVTTVSHTVARSQQTQRWGERALGGACYSAGGRLDAGRGSDLEGLWGERISPGH